VATALALAGCSLIDSFTFFPSREVGPLPPGATERWIETPDGERLHAWHAVGAAAGPTLVWSHGNAGNIASRAWLVQALAARGLRVLAYDYRGYGRSTGSPSEAGVYRDALAVFDDEVRRGTPAGAIVCFGESLGGAVSINLATERPCAGVIVVSTFTRLADVARRHYGPLGALAGKRFDSLARVVRLQVPLFVAHGDQDEIVPFEQGERLFAAAPGPKRFFRVANAHHDDPFASSALVDAVAAFAREVARR
jgi:fermentation-respiration switch protein FrsA (DUF1100 family)